ncbi:MAG: ATP-dependent DNA ligase [Sandaracinus sp.]
MARARNGKPPPPPPQGFVIDPPVEPMLSRPVEGEGIPEGALSYEPKWDGFRALVFREGDALYVQSRDLRPLDRYFPELCEALKKALPASLVVDGEIVIATEHGLDFQALQLRLHPAASRVAKLAAELPASFVAFDLLALAGEDLRALPQVERRARLERSLAGVAPPIHVTPSTRDPALAAEWFRRFEGAGLDGVIAKPDAAPYEPGKRTMFKIKHARTADCVVAGFRWHKDGEGERVGSLLLGLYDDAGQLQHVGVTSSFTMQKRRELVSLLAPLREGAMQAHPWRAWMEAMVAETGGDPSAMQRMPGGQSRWSQGKDLSWEPLRLERVCEVKYDHLEGSRFRHAATFQRWREDKRPEDCRYDQLEVTPAYELARIFGRAPRPL